jgi:hypothetical protein
LAQYKKQNITISKPIYKLNKKTKVKQVVWERLSNEVDEEYHSSNDLENYIEVNKIDELIQHHRTLVEHTREAEIRRLNKECFLNKYEAKYNVSMKELLSAIVGEEYVHRKMGVLNDQKKAFTEKLAQTKTYNFFKK